MFNIKQKIKYVFKRQVIILMYHRIASPEMDPWQLAVSANNFEEHLNWLKTQNIVRPLPQIIDQLKENKLTKKCIAITFDDGYADNYFTAKPLLEKYDIPATFFITSGNVDSKHEFWWDEMAKIILQTQQLSPTLSLEINGKQFFYNLSEESILTADLRKSHSHYIAGQPGTLRSELYYKLWEWLSPLPAEAQRQLMEKLRSWAGVAEDPRPDYRCMSSGQIKELSASGLFITGGHTVTHPALSYYNKETQHREISGNKLFLEQITGRKINLFAYPSGNYNTSAIEVLKELDFEAAFTTNAKTVKNFTDPFIMGRFQVNNWTSSELQKMLLKWSDR